MRFFDSRTLNPEERLEVQPQAMPEECWGTLFALNSAQKVSCGKAAGDMMRAQARPVPKMQRPQGASG